jgi:transposase
MNEGYRRCCGMDIHKDTIVVCALPPVGQDGQTIRKVYGTFRNDLIRMRVWLKQLKVTEIAMESTGVYWRPVWNVLDEEGFLLLTRNACPIHMKFQPPPFVMSIGIGQAEG